MNNKKILAIASGGGHWVQLQRIRHAFHSVNTVYACVDKMYGFEVAPNKFYVIKNVNRIQKWDILLTLTKLAYIFYKENPSIIITTGSAPGMLALRMGKIFKKKTIWIDSIANVTEMSLSGKIAKKYADYWLTQWPHLEKPEGPQFIGSVI